MIEMNCHASASVKSEMHASRDLIHETIYQLNLRVMITTDEMEKSKICGRGLNTSQSPPHPPSKEVAIPDHTQKGLEK